MEDGFPYPLWVEGDWESGIPKLKNKLNIYFQSRKSNGGDCSVEYEASDGQRAVARFRTEEVRQRVLDKHGHELKLGQGVLKLTVRLPQSEEKCSSSPETSGEISLPDGGDKKEPSTQTLGETNNTVETVQEEVEAEAELVTVSMVLENVPEQMSREVLEMLVENISDTSAEQGDFSLEIIPDISATVVTFKNSKNVSDFLSKCSRNKMFKKNKLSARALEVTNSVRVDRIPPSVSTHFLQLYFEREGKEDVEEVKQLEDEDSTLITFRNPKGVNEVTKKMHCIQETHIEVYPYYKSLGTALYGKERPTLKLPESFIESMNSALWKFLQDKKLVEEIHEIMAVNFCKVDLKSSEVLISPLPSLLKEKGLTAKHINGWKENAILTFRLAISKFQSFEYEVTPAVWKESETQIRGALTEAVILVPDMARGVVTLVGLAEDVNRLKDALMGSVGTAARKLVRERDSIMVEAPLAPSVYHILQQDGLPQKIATEYPELKMTYSQEDQKMFLCGLSAEVYAAKSKVLEQVVTLKRKVVDVEENVLAFLCEADKDELCNSLFKEAGIRATYETLDSRVQLVGGTDQALRDAEKWLKTALGSYSIPVEDQNVLSKPEWQDLVTRLKESFDSPGKKVKVRRTGYDTKQEVVVSGFQCSVDLVGQELCRFVSNNTIVEVNVDVKSQAALKFIQDHKKETWSKAVEEDIDINFNYETGRPSMRLHGPRAHMAEFQNLLQTMISSVHFDTLKITKPGAKKFFKEKQDMLVERVAAKKGCVVQLVEEDSDARAVQAMEDEAQTGKSQARITIENKLENKQPSAGQDRVQTKEGLTIILSKGNIQDASTAVIVNVLGENLSLDSGNVSKAILSAAGPELQNLVQAEAARTNPVCGGVLITEGCSLKSQNVFHAITPHCDKKTGKTDKVLERIVEECLEKAEELQRASIAFPTIGGGNLGFPKDLVASTLLGRILSFSSQKNPQHVKEVVIVLHPSDPQTSQAFYTECSKRFTGFSAGQRQPSNPAAAPTQPGKALFSKITAIPQGHEMRVGGVLLQVVTGDITTETSDVIVNSSNADFSLRSGVSKAILDAAGPTVDAECKQLGAQAKKDMIMTQPGNLKSKKIFHIVGQTDVAKITGSVKAVLQMCAQNKFASVSFPALGTGQGGVDASQVADAILDAVEDVVKQDPAMSLKLVRLVIFQAPMLTHFHSSMQRRESTGTQTKAPKFTFGKLFLKRGKTEDKKNKKTFILKSKTPDPAIFHLCGGSQASVEEGKRWIQDLFLRELIFDRITDEAISDLSEEDGKEIQELQDKLQVGVSLEEGNPESTIIVEGLSVDVIKATSQIRRLLKETRLQQQENREAELIHGVVEWQYQQGGQYHSFHILANRQLEQALQNQQPDVTIKIHGQPYKVSLPDGPAVDRGGNQLPIKRIDKLEESHNLPNHWSTMGPGQQCLLAPLQAGTAEHNEVLQLFQATCPNPIKVLKIERVQNPCMWWNYQIFKKNMDHTNGHWKNEKRLFHGTNQSAIQEINHNGFNRSDVRKDGDLNVNGIEFTVGASDSANSTHTVPDPQGQKYMYLCRVLTGDFTAGNAKMKEPPIKSNSSFIRYNSVTDNTANPTKYFTFKDNQAYPEHLITFQ